MRGPRERWKAGIMFLSHDDCSVGGRLLTARSARRSGGQRDMVNESLNPAVQCEEFELSWPVPLHSTRESNFSDSLGSAGLGKVRESHLLARPSQDALESIVLARFAINSQYSA